MRLAHVELSSAGDTISSGTFTAKENLKVKIHTIDDGNQNPKMRFNGSSASDYAYRYSINGGSGSTSTSQNGIYHFADDNGNKSIVCNITNISNKEKLILSHSLFGATGSGTAPYRAENVAKWTNTSDSITSITLVNEFAGDFGVGSYMTVWGASDDVVSDEKDSLTNVEAGTRYEEVDTRKIYRWVDTTPVSWSATNQTWTQTGTAIALSGSTFTATNSADNANPSNRVVSNEQTALSTDWICDFEYQTSDSDMNQFPLIIGNTNAKVTASNFDRVHIEGAGNASNFLRLKGMVGGSALNGDNSITGVSGTQYYGRIVKNALVVTLKIYGSSSDRENGTNQVSNTSTITFSSTPNDFKFYQVSGRGDGGGGTPSSWVTKNVKIYDGVTSPKLWKERGTA